MARLSDLPFCICPMPWRSATARRACHRDPLPSRSVRVMLLVNPRSGVGRGQRFAAQLADDLRARGLSVNILTVGEEADRLLRHGALARADALVVAGGDGTLCRVAELAAAADRPVWHCPLGNENLFAREFGMTRDADQIADAVRAQRVRRIDRGLANGQTFTIMASVGFDAAIVHRLARVRVKAIGHRSYALPALAEIVHHRVPALTITVEGQPIVERQRGLAVIANSPLYGVDLNPAATAVVDDGLLDVAFLPASNVLSLGRWFVSCRLGRQGTRHDYLTARGREIRVEAFGRWAPVQIDGEAPGIDPETPVGQPPVHARTPLVATVEPGAIPVLEPVEPIRSKRAARLRPHDRHTPTPEYAGTAPVGVAD
ncbi:MAG: hypothetical protein EA378_04690 [Phycisphaerales bacterium]|nr:MAG: hypothetical protein EA378_04690 [Phycisphaerales bacterium]